MYLTFMFKGSFNQLAQSEVMLTPFQVASDQAHVRTTSTGPDDLSLKVIEKVMGENASYGVLNSAA